MPLGGLLCPDICSADAVGMGPTDRAAGSDRPTAIQGAFNRAHGGAPTAQPATEPSIARRGCSTAVGSQQFAAFATARGPAPPHRRPPSPASGGGQDNRRGNVATDRGRTPLASEDDLSQRPRYAHSLSGLRHRGGQPLAPLGERAGRRALYRLGSVRGRRLLERHRFRRQPDDRVSARWAADERSRAVPNRGDQPYLGRCFWRRRGGRRPMAAGRVGKLRQAEIAKAAARPDRRCGGNAVEEVAADKGNTVGRAVRLPATAASESGKAAHTRTACLLQPGAG